MRQSPKKIVDYPQFYKSIVIASLRGNPVQKNGIWILSPFYEMSNFKKSFKKRGLSPFCVIASLRGNLIQKK